MDNKEFIKKLEDLETEGMAQTKEWSNIWQSSLRYFFSDQLQGKKKHPDWDWVVLNYIWPAARQEVAKLSKNPAKIVTIPWEDSDSDVAEIWQSVGHYLWHKGINGRGMQLEQIGMLMAWKMYGVSISKIFWEPKCYWDAQRKKWLGDVKYKLWHPQEFWALGQEDINDGPCGTTRYVDLEWAVDKWPDKKKQLTEESAKWVPPEGGNGVEISGQHSSTFSLGGKGDGDSGPDKANVKEISEVLMKLMRTPSVREIESRGKNAEIKKIVKISEIWFKDYEEKRQKIENPIPAEQLLATGEIYNENNVFLDKNGSEMTPEKWPTVVQREWDEPLYPNGRRIVRCGDYILNDKPQEQVWGHSKWPFVTKPHYLLPFTWRGLDGVSLYKNTQDLINVSATHLLQNMKLHGDPKIYVERGAIDSPAGRQKEHFRIGAGAGYIVRLTRGGLNKIREAPPAQPSASAMFLYSLFGQEFKNIMGMQDIAMGKAGKRTTATEAQQLAISSNDCVALQSVMLDSWIKDCATMILDVCQQNYDEGRYIRIAGDEIGAGVKQITQRLKDTKFDVDIVRSATLPFDEEKKLIKYQQAYQLLGNPMPNPMLPEMLRELGIPNWKKLLQKYEVYQQYVALAQLYEGVKTGHILPQDAVNAIVQKATQLYQQEQANSVPMAQPKAKPGGQKPYSPPKG